MTAHSLRTVDVVRVAGPDRQMANAAAGTGLQLALSGAQGCPGATRPGIFTRGLRPYDDWMERTVATSESDARPVDSDSRSQDTATAVAVATGSGCLSCATDPRSLLALQRAAGNGAVQRLLAGHGAPGVGGAVQRVPLSTLAPSRPASGARPGGAVSPATAEAAIAAAARAKGRTPPATNGRAPRPTGPPAAHQLRAHSGGAAQPGRAPRTAPGAGPATAGGGPTSQRGPGPGSAIGQPRTPTAQDPGSGVDWVGLLTSDAPNYVRTPLEISRLVPGFGLLGGAAADMLNLAQDEATLAPVEAPVTKTFVAIRDIVNLVDNGLGHFAYVDQLIQDGATISIAGVELDALTAPVQEAVKTAKIVLDEVLGFLDVGLLATAKYEEMHAPPGPQADAWKSMVNNYAANAIGDIVNLTVDIYDLATAGAGQGQTLEEGAKAAKFIFPVGKYFINAVKSVALGWFGIWGSKVPFDGALAPDQAAPGPVQRRAGAGSPSPSSLDRSITIASADIMLSELDQMKLGYDGGTDLVNQASESLDIHIAELRAVTASLNGGKDPINQFRDAGAQMMHKMQLKVGQLNELMQVSSTVGTKTTSILGFCTDAEAKIGAIQVPNIAFQRHHSGDDLLSQAEDAVANAAQAAAETAANELLGQLRPAVGTAKQAALDPITALHAHAREVAEFMQVLQDTAGELLAFIQSKLDDFGRRLGHCESITDYINLILHEVSALIGSDEDLNVAGFKADWVALGSTIDQTRQWAVRVRAEAERAAPETPTGSAATDPPPDQEPPSDT